MTETTKDTIYNDDNSDLSQGETFEGSGSWTDQLALNKNGRACNTSLLTILRSEAAFPGTIIQSTGAMWMTPISCVS